MASSSSPTPPAARSRTTATRSGSSFSRHASATTSTSSSSSHSKGVKRGPNGSAFISSGIADLDRVLGGGFSLGTLVLIAEDPDAPHHLLLLRSFMSQGLIHRHPLLFAAPSTAPASFLGTLPAPQSATQPSTADEQSREMGEKGLRIAWQYRKYFGEQPSGVVADAGTDQAYCNEFDLRRPMDRRFLASQNIECLSLLEFSNLGILRDKCSQFLTQFSRNDGNLGLSGRIAIQSFCAPQCCYFNSDWEMLSFLRYLRAMVRSSNAVAVVTFPASILSASTSKRWQHLADTFLTVRALPDEDRELAKLLTGYQDMLGLLHVHKVAQINSQVPVILEATTFSLKLHRRKSLVLERLNQAPVDGSGGSACTTAGSQKTFDF